MSTFRNVKLDIHWSIAGLIALKLILHLWAVNQYDYFIDEYYYLAQSLKPALGYVDHAPFSIWLLKASTAVFGDSLLALRLPAILAGALVIFLTSRIAREMEGGVFAQFLGGLTALIAPIYLGVNKFYSMNSLEHFFWTGALFYVIRVTKANALRDWVLLGIALGLAVMNKHSGLFLGFGIGVGLVLSPQRKLILSKGPWVAAGIAALFFLPNLYWLYANDWATLEFMANARKFKNYFSLPGFLGAQVLEMHPLSFPIWLTGLFFLLATKRGRTFQLAGWFFLALLVLFIFTKAKSYYLSPAYPVLLAAGAIQLESWLDKGKKRGLRYGLTALLFLGGGILAPLSLPLLEPETYIAYEKTLGVAPPKIENHAPGRLPQHFATMFGWRDISRATRKTFNALPASEQKQTIVLGSNYGFAGALQFHDFRDLRNIVGSPHNEYFRWGLPLTISGQPARTVISLGYSQQDLEKYFESVQLVKSVNCEYCMGYRRVTNIFVCRNPKQPLENIWPTLKSYL